MPKDTVDITVDLRDNRRQVRTAMTHQVVPTDILIRQRVSACHAYVTIQQAADTTRCIHLAFLAEGYRAEDMPTFITDVHTAVEAIFATSRLRA
jgi:hypothetical protein